MNLFILFLFFYFKIYGFVQVCSVSYLSSCLLCNFSYYQKNYYETYLSSFSSNDCLPKIKINNIYSKSIYITNNSIYSSVSEDGTINNPYSSIIKAIIKELNFSQEYGKHNLKFKLLGKYHYILKNDLNFTDILLFKNIIGNISFAPLYCSELNILNCFQNGEQAFLIVKDDYFKFYISSSFLIENILFDFSDLYLQISSPSHSCLNDNLVCCNKEMSIQSYSKSKNPCSLNGNYTYSPNIKNLKKIEGFFNIFSVYDYSLDEYSNKLELILINVTFQNFYNLKNETGWFTLLKYDDCKINIEFERVKFENLFFKMGLIVQLFLINDPTFINYDNNYKKLRSDKCMLIYQKNYFNMKNCSFIKYNLYNIIHFFDKKEKNDQFYYIFNFYNSTHSVLFETSLFYNLSIPKENPITLFRFQHSLPSIKISLIYCVLENLNQIALLDLINSTSIFFKINFFNISMTNTLIAFNLKSFSNLDLNFCVFEKINLLSQTSSMLGFYLSYNTNILINTTFFLFSSEIYFDSSFNSNLIIDSSIFWSLRSPINKIFINTLNSINLIIKNCKFFAFSIQNIFKSSDLNFLIDGCIFLNFLTINFLTITKTTDFQTIVTFSNSLVKKFEIVPERKNVATAYLLLFNLNKIKEFYFKNIVIVDSTELVVVYARDLFEKIQIFSLDLKNTDCGFYYCFIFAYTKLTGKLNLNLERIRVSNVTMRRALYLIFISNIDFTNVYDLNIYNFSFIMEAIKTPVALSQKHIFLTQNGVKVNIEKFIIQYLAKEEIRFFYRIFFIPNIVLNQLYFVNIHKENTRAFAFFVADYAFFNIKLTNSIFKNFRFMGVGESVQDIFGLVSFLGTYSLLWAENSNSLILENNTFYNFTGFSQNGMVTILNFNNVTIKNNSFIQMASAQGGAMSFLFISQLNIEDNDYISCIAIKGGSILFNFIKNISLINIKVIDSISMTQGGGFHLEKIDLGYINQLLIKNSASNDYGGGLSIKVSSSSLFNLSFIYIENVYSNYGGAIFSEDVFLLISNASIKNSFSLIGGFLFLKGRDSNLYLNRIFIFNASVEKQGAVLYIEYIQNLDCDLLVIQNCENKNEGYGTISLLGFLSNQSFDGNLSFNNIYCIENRAMIGSCFYLFTNKKFQLKNFIAEKNKGSPMSLASELRNIITIENITLKHNNLDNNFLMLNTILIEIYDCIINFKNSFIYDNLIKESLLKAYNSEIYFENLIIKLIHLKSEQNNNIFFIISLEECKIIFNSSKMDGELRKKPLNYEACFIFSIQNDIIFYSTSLSNFWSPSSQPIYLEETNFHSQLSNFINNTGSTSGSIRSVNSNITIMQSLFSSIGNSKIKLKSNLNNIIDLLISKSKSYKNVLYCLVNQSIFQVYNQTIALKIVQLDFIFLNEVNFNYKNNKNDDIKYIIASGLQLIDINDAQITNCSFNSLYGIRGGCLFSQYLGVSYSKLNITNSEFYLCTSLLGAAIYIFGNIATYIENDYFIYNNAIRHSIEDNYGIGACLIMDCINFINCSTQLISSYFYKNLAENYAATIISNNENIILKKNIFKDNYYAKGLQTNYYISFPISLKKFNESEIKVIASGMYFEFEVEIKDSLNENLFFDNFSMTSIEILSSPKYMTFEKSMAESVLGKFSFTKVKFITDPNSLIKAGITLNFDLNIFFPTLSTGYKHEISLNLSFYVRNCTYGEILQDDRSCLSCPVNTFSLMNPMNQLIKIECQLCPEYAECPGGSQIIPIKGYWRENNMTTIVFECPIQETCLGNKEISVEDENCALNHFGRLCYICELGFARPTPKSLCQSCNSILTYIKLFGFLIFLVIYLSLQVKILGKYKNKQPNVAICLRILLNHLQTLGMITLIKIRWDVNFKSFMKFQDYLEMFTEDHLSIDCFFMNYNKEILMIKAIATELFPIIFLLFMMIFWALKNKCKILCRRKRNIIKAENKSNFLEYMSSKTKLSFIILFYVMYPEILKKCFLIMNCILIDENQKISVIYQSPLYECWGSRHIAVFLTVTLPGIFIWGIMVPFVFGYYIFKNKKLLGFFQLNLSVLTSHSKKMNKNLLRDLVEVYKKNMVKSISDLNVNVKESIILKENQQFESQIKESDISRIMKNSTKAEKVFQNMMNVGILFRGYKNEYYYWELVIFARKFILIFFAISTEFFTETYKAMIFVLNISFFLLLQYKHFPYSTIVFNRIEFYSLVICYLNGGVGILISSNSFHFSSFYLSLFIIIGNLLFLIVWFVYFWNFSKKMAFFRQISRRMTHNIKKMFTSTNVSKVVASNTVKKDKKQNKDIVKNTKQMTGAKSKKIYF